MVFLSYVIEKMFCGAGIRGHLSLDCGTLLALTVSVEPMPKTKFANPTVCMKSNTGFHLLAYVAIHGGQRP